MALTIPQTPALDMISRLQEVYQKHTYNTPRLMAQQMRIFVFFLICRRHMTIQGKIANMKSAAAEITMMIIVSMIRSRCAQVRTTESDRHQCKCFSRDKALRVRDGRIPYGCDRVATNEIEQGYQHADYYDACCRANEEEPLPKLLEDTKLERCYSCFASCDADDAKSLAHDFHLIRMDEFIESQESEVLPETIRCSYGAEDSIH